ncbi:large subunit ribosomal protein L28e [Microdochium nivale]|nr:large subunit ribosomal protein L28e [Microdochium nivale]
MASADLVWEIVRNQNAYLVKRKTGGGVQFSSDPLNLTNKHSRKYAGFVNDKAIGVVPGEKGGVTVISKRAADVQKPAKCINTTNYHGGKTSRNTYKAVANHTAKNSYRPDLREVAVARTSHLLQSQRSKKDVPEKKLRGKKAAAAAESS